MDCLNKNNNYKIYAECCNEYICCYICHNKSKNHRLNRFTQIEHVLCSRCNHKNEFPFFEQYCQSCDYKFSENICKKCNIYHGNYDYFHCDQCRICYKGKKSNYKHCTNCNHCYGKESFSNHKCEIIKDVCNCQICLSEVFNPNGKTLILRCSHIIHENCLRELIKHSENNNNIPKCTICKSCINNPLKYEKFFDEKIKKFKINKERDNWKSEYLCFDCKKKNITKYHHYYHKCLDCRSYNTTVLNIIKD